ncbi:YdcP family protein [Bacillus cereus]|uniref:YdcP family protein n=2 Tax=Bacillota TaxID=1239 RepID=UPI00214A2DE1|nr:YdcP family protein [Bacillus cereus]MCR2013856.1 YdcP family protein [Bacillus cereus]
MATMKICPDINKTFGELMYLGKEERFHYKDGVKTDVLKSVTYKLASSAQGGEVPVTVNFGENGGTSKDFPFMAKVGIKDVEISASASVNGTFASVRYTVTASEIFQASAGTK